MIRQNRVVITGLGVLAANGIGKDAFWNALLAGESGIGPITLFDASELPCRIAGEVKYFNPLDFMEPSMKPRRMGRFSQLAVAAVSLALNDADIPLSEMRSKNEVEIVLGVATSDIDLVVDPPKLYSTPSLVPHAAATSVSRYLGTRSKLHTISNACTSGLDSIAKGAELISSGKTDFVICGSSEASVTYTTMRSLAAAGMLPTEMNETPEKASCPFSEDRTGGLLSEGAGIVILESYEHARSRGAAYYAEVHGSGNWIHPNAREDGAALVYSMETAIGNSNILPSDIDYISAHGPSDPILDRVETECIKNVFGERSYSIPISSIKAVTGNPFASGGALQCVATAMTFASGLIAPTANLSRRDAYCDLDYVPNEPRRFSVKTALVNSRGVGGGNSSLILTSGNRTC